MGPGYRHIQVGDDLTGKTLYFNFPSSIATTSQPQSDTETIILTDDNAAITAEPGGFPGTYHNVVFNARTPFVWVYLFSDIVGDEVNLTSLTPAERGGRGGIVTFIDDTFPILQYIWIEDTPSPEPFPENPHPVGLEGKLHGRMFYDGKEDKAALFNGVQVFGAALPEYITDGLAHHLDAINNVDVGTHDPTAAVWFDLAGGNNGSCENIIWDGGDCAKFNGTNSLVEFAGTVTARYTIMGTMAVVHTPGTHPGGWQPRFVDGTNNTYPGFYFRNSQSATNDRDFAYAMWANGQDRFIAPRTPSPNNERIHIAYQHDGTEFRLYVNGVLTGTQATTANAASRALTTLGFSRAYANRALTGEICNFMRYTRVLTEDEIQNNYEVDKIRFGIEP